MHTKVPSNVSHKTEKRNSHGQFVYLFPRKTLVSILIINDEQYHLMKSATNTHIDTKLETEQSKVIDNRTSLVSARFLAKFGSPPINYSTKDCFPFPVVHDLVESSGE
ncbi:hypothetical protein V1477_003953 [Vespula maculifrons]|uniref:Uncharacterized protein n=1 Tax=Vespula maculifrons TaxID=7453 RepID=A0ABD2CSF3_VESMC